MKKQEQEAQARVQETRPHVWLLCQFGDLSKMCHGSSMVCLDTFGCNKLDFCQRGCDFMIL